MTWRRQRRREYVTCVTLFAFLLILLTTADVDASQPTTHIVGDSQACSMRYTSLSKGMKITCKGGTSTQQWHTKIDEADVKPGDTVIVFLGSNDWYRKPDPKPILVKLKGTKCVWVGPPDMPKHRGPAADHLKKEVEADGTCKFLDSRTLRLKLPDGVHTSEPGRWLSEALKRL